jgi:hypothetical protein
MKGIDFTTPITLAKAKELKVKGYDFICRYLVPEAYKSKRLTKAEAEAATASGLKILSVFEIYEDFRKIKGGTRSAEVAGREDGKAAYKEAKLIGMPIGSTIYFAVDFDTRDYDMVETYLRNVFAEIAGYACGVYGSYYIVEEMARRKTCTHFWQTYAWSRGQVSKHNNVYQYENGVSICGISADLNEAADSEGFWNIEVPKITKILKYGMEGEQVKLLQGLLNDLGYKLIEDGSFGLITQGAVRDFQRSHGLQGDGIVGPITRAKLYEG